MADIMLALSRTLSSLRQRKLWIYVLIPAVFSLLLTFGLAIWGLGALVERLLTYPPMTLHVR